MTKELHLLVITPERRLLDQHVSRVTLPEVDGYVTLLPGHAALVAEVGNGDLEFQSIAGAVNHVAVSGGYLLVNDNTVKVLANSALVPDEIDVDRVKAAERRALDRLRSGDPNIDYQRAVSALNRAQARLAVVSTHHMEG